MDVSSNIGAKNLDKQIEAVVHLIKHSDVANNVVQFSFTTFTDQYKNKIEFHDFSDATSLISEINSNTRIIHGSMANVSNVLEYVHTSGFTSVNGARPNSRKVVIVFSSGLVDDMALTESQSKMLKASGYLVVTVGIGLDANYSNLVDISSDPAFTFILGDDVNQEVDDLEALLSTLEYSTCSHI